MHRIRRLLEQPVSAAPLAVFRILFGMLTLISTVRFLWLGWAENQYLSPKVHFPYYGFEWVTVPSAPVLYGMYGLMILASCGILLGLFYRISAIAFFLLFTYLELMDISYYLNHYYFVSLAALIICFLPLHVCFSLDNLLNIQSERQNVPGWTRAALMLQLGITYVFAGIAKLEADWLLEAQPLRIWLPAHDNMPVLGSLLRYKVTAYFFSWFGLVYDLFIVFFLLWRKTRLWAYAAVLAFHLMTGYLFQIGVFPVVMIFLTLIFFSSEFHEKIISLIRNLLSAVFRNSLVGRNRYNLVQTAPLLEGSERALSPSVGDKAFGHSAKAAGTYTFKPLSQKLCSAFFIVFFLFQLLFPFRYLLYGGNLLWHEQGYRFSWRVMLMEKAGTATFYVQDGTDGRKGTVRNADFLNRHQEKQMSMQPDMILYFAHFLDSHFKNEGMKDPVITAEVYVTLNGRPSRLLIDPKCDLSLEKDTFLSKSWILPFNHD